MNHIRRVFCLLVAVLLAACASSGVLPGKSREPGVIVIRNKSGRNADSMSVQQDRGSETGPLRMGAISPVIANMSYPFVRPNDAPSLPNKIRVNWQFPTQSPQSAVVSTGEALKNATGAPGEAIVFELQPSGVKVYLDQVEPSSP